MHRVIENGLEDYLDGKADRAVDLHLAGCAACREEIAEVRRTSVLLQEFRSAEPLSPSLGFQARAMRHVTEQKAGKVWGLLSADPGFARKLAFGSLLGLAALGGYLFTGADDSMAQADHTPEAVMASHDAGGADQQQHLNGMLVTLATYHQ